MTKLVSSWFRAPLKFRDRIAPVHSGPADIGLIAVAE